MVTIPKEQQSAYQRWEMTSFGDERPSVVALREAEQRELDAQQEREALEQADLAQADEQGEGQGWEPGQEYGDEAEDVAAPPQFPTAEELDAIREQSRLEGQEQGYEEGRAAGHADALAEGKIATAEELEHVRAIAANFSNALQDADQAIAADVLELALQLAKGMLKNALQVKPELILPIVRDAIEYLPVLQQPALLVLHPDDAAVVREGIGEELDKGGWRVVEDASVGRGGCKVDTASNQIDASAAARWQRLAHALGKDVDWLG